MGFKYFVLDVDGNVYPCAILASYGKPIANLKTTSVKDIWNNNTYQLARRIFRDKLQDKYKDFIWFK